MSFRKQIQHLAYLLAQVEIWVLVLASVASLIWIDLLPAAVITAAFFWIVRYLATGRLSVRTPSDWAIFLLAIATIVTLWVTPEAEITRPQVFRLWLGIALYYAIANWSNSTPKIRWVTIGSIFLGLMLAFSAPITVNNIMPGRLIASLPFLPRLSSLMSDAIHPHVMAGSLVILLPLALAWLAFGWSETSQLERILIAIASATMLAVIILTRSRGAWMAILASLGILVALRWRRGWILVLSALLILVGVLRIYEPLQIVIELSSTGAIGGLDQRLEVWSRAMYMIEDFPFTGIGMGLFERMTDVLYPLFLNPPGTIVHSHNVFLQVALDLGIPGFIGWLAILLTSLWGAWLIFRSGFSTQNKLFSALGAGLLSSQVGLILHGLIDVVIWGVMRSSLLVWIIWGLVASGCAVSYQAQNFHLKRVLNLEQRE